MYDWAMLNKGDAEQTLQKHYQKLKQCLDGAWDSWHKHYNHRHHVLDARARAAIVYCEIVALARQLFDGAPDVKIVKRRLMCWFYFGDDIVLRFKKLKNRKPRNVQTAQQTLLELQRPLDGVLPGTYVTAGYELDQIQQAVAERLVLAYLNGKEVWAIDLNIGGDAGTVQVMPAMEPPKKPKTGRVKARQTEVPKKAQESE